MLRLGARALPVRPRRAHAARTADLADEARRLAVRLADPELSLPRTPAAGLEPDPVRWAKSLRPPMRRLDRLLKERERRRLGASDGVLEQRRALQACEATYLLVARTAEALLRLAGENELARRLRGAITWARLRRLLARGAGRTSSWAESRKALVFQLARGSLKAPNL